MIKYFLPLFAVVLAPMATALETNLVDGALLTVRTAWTNVSSGDTIRIPAGSNTWTGTLVLPAGKNVNIIGAGIGQTIITTTSQFLDVNSGSRISGIEAFNTANPTFWIYVKSASNLRFRIDNCKFGGIMNGSKKTLIQFSGTTALGHPYGLFDNNQCYNMRLQVYGNQSLYAWNIWAEPLDMGTDKAVYIEDNTFTQDVFGNCIDSNYGSRYVFRYNTMVGSVYLEAHGNQNNTSRGSRLWEIYGNTLTNAGWPVHYTVSLRGGTGVCFSNVWTGTYTYGANAGLDVVRALKPDGNVNGLCYGNGVPDGNDPISGGTGTHTGGSGLASLIDTTKSFGSLTSGRSVPSGKDPNFWLWNLTSGARGKISGNTPTTVTASLSGGSRTTWNNGDSYKITGGYPTRDGIGAGTDPTLGSVGNWPTMTLDPAYFWANKMNGATMGATVYNGCGFFAQSGRDFFVNVGAKPGYTPYTYPHPLRGEGGGEDPETNGEISFSLASINVDEDEPSITLTLLRSNGTDGIVSVDWATANGTASAGSDYTSTNGTVTWAATDGASQNITIPLLDDASVEGAQTFTVNLSNATGGATVSSPSTVTVTINDVEPQNGQASLTFSEYSVSEAGTSVTVTAKRLVGSDGAVTVDYTTGDSTALAGTDYTTASGTFSWAAGNMDDKTAVIIVADRTGFQGSRSLTFTLSNPTGGLALASPSAANIVITDDEEPDVPLLPLSFLAAEAYIQGPFIRSQLVSGLDSVFQQEVWTSDPTMGGRLEARVNVVTPGLYVLWILGSFPDASSDSFFVEIDDLPQVDDASFMTPFTAPGELSLRYARKQWSGATGVGPQNARRVWSLSSGVHTIRIWGREADAWIHRVELVKLAAPQTIQLP